MLGLRLGIWRTVYIYQMNRNVACHDVSTIHAVIGIVVFPSPLMGVTSIFRYCDERMSVCRYVCPLAYLKKSHAQTSRNFPYMLSVAVWLGPPLTTVQYVMYFRFCG